MDTIKADNVLVTGQNASLEKSLRQLEIVFAESEGSRKQLERDAQLWHDTAATLEHEVEQYQNKLGQVVQENGSLSSKIQNLESENNHLKSKDNFAGPNSHLQLESENEQLKGVISQMRRDMEDLHSSLQHNTGHANRSQASRPATDMDFYRDDATHMHSHIGQLQQLLNQKQTLVDHLLKTQAQLHKKLNSSALNPIQEVKADDDTSKRYKALAHTLKNDNKALKKQMMLLEEEWRVAVQERDTVLELSNELKAELEFLRDDVENRKDTATQTSIEPSKVSSKPPVKSIPKQKPLAPKRSVSPVKQTEDPGKSLRAKGIRNWNDKDDA